MVVSDSWFVALCETAAFRLETAAWRDQIIPLKLRLGSAARSRSVASMVGSWLSNMYLVANLAAIGIQGNGSTLTSGEATAAPPSAPRRMVSPLPMAAHAIRDCCVVLRSGSAGLAAAEGLHLAAR